MYQQGGTIKQALDKIASNAYVLPAIQREFVWSPDQICRLFDSLMQGYPFGEFLFWNIRPEHSADYRYYGFVRDYHERDDPHCPDLGPLPNQPITHPLPISGKDCLRSTAINGSDPSLVFFRRTTSKLAGSQTMIATGSSARRRIELLTSNAAYTVKTLSSIGG